LTGALGAADQAKAAFDTNHAASKMAIVDDMFSLPKENQQRRTIE
jgi:hypothetical protein